MNRLVIAVVAFLLALNGFTPVMAQSDVLPGNGKIRVQERRDAPGQTQRTTAVVPHQYLPFGGNPEHPEFCPAQTKGATGVPDNVLTGWGWKRVYPSQDVYGRSYGRDGKYDLGWMSKDERWAVDPQGFLRRLVCGNRTDIQYQQPPTAAAPPPTVIEREKVVVKEVVRTEYVFAFPSVTYPVAPMPQPMVNRDVTKYMLNFNFPIERPITNTTNITAGNGNGNGAGSTNSGNATGGTGNGGTGGTGGTGGAGGNSTANGGTTTNQNNSGSSSNSTNTNTTGVNTGSGTNTTNGNANGNSRTNGTQFSF